MSELDNFALASLIPFLPPKVQKIIIDTVLRNCKITLQQDTLEEYEKYYQRVEEKFQQDYMEKK